MRALFPSAADEVDIHDWYADGWLDGTGVRANFVTSIDGAVSSAGKSEGLQTSGDNRIFAALRDLADVVVVGASTATVESYQPVTLSARRTAVRQRYGLAATLPTVVVSRSLSLDPTLPLYRPAADQPSTVVLTCAAADAAVRAALRANCEVVDCGVDDVVPALVREALVTRGHRRILAEGGPRLFASFAGAGAIDELCLSVSPLLAGPGASRITVGDAWAGTPSARLRGLLSEDDALFARYTLIPD